MDIGYFIAGLVGSFVSYAFYMLAFPGMYRRHREEMKRLHQEHQENMRRIHEDHQEKMAIIRRGEM